MSAPVNGYVLAGGRSSRMGRDKALLELGGRTLVERAVGKLGRICAEVKVLGGTRMASPELERFAPVVADLHPGCGPIGGMEAALAESSREWNLFLAVDMPFLPAGWIAALVETWLGLEDGAWVRMLSADGAAQPGFCLLHREVGALLTEAIARGEYKLTAAFAWAARELAARSGREGDAGMWCEPVERVWERLSGRAEVSEAQRAVRRLWFANVNTPEEFAVAEESVAALD